MAFFDQMSNYDRLLSRAVNNIHPLMIFCNLSNNFYQVISYSNSVLNDSIAYSGNFDDLISITKESIKNTDYANLFFANFSRQHLLERASDNDSQIELHFPYSLRDSEQWVELQGIFVCSESSNVQLIILGKNINEEKRRKEESQRTKELLVVLAGEYSNVYTVNLDTGEFFAYNFSERIDCLIGETVRSRIPFSEAFKIYAEKCTFEEDKEDFLSHCSMDYILSQLSIKDRFTHRYRNESNQYCEMKCVKLGDWSKERCVVFGFAVKDTEIRREMQAKKELQAAKEKAESASATKSEFLARMSHDIRTPINGVIGMAELALRNLENPQKISQCMQKVIKTANHLNMLVNDILDMSHIESKKIEIAHRALNILSLADGCLSIIEGELVNRKLKLITESDDFKHPFVIGDELHLRQALVNILGNAVKFTPDGGKITFRIQELDFGLKTVTYRFEVEDTGIGMKSEFLEHIWETFSQEDGGARTEYKGTGLGTAIAKSLVELMGGTISVKSKLNEGSTFTIDMPFAIDDRTAAARKNDILKSESIETLAGSRILLVEDNSINSQTAKELLEADGAYVVTAENGKSAVNLFAKSRLNFYDAILMDIMMPVMNGIEATKEIRSMSRSDASITPIIALTANAFEEDVRKSIDSGMNAHLTKPLEISHVVKTLINCMRQKSLKQAEELNRVLLNIKNKDMLTGVGNSHAFNEVKLTLNEKIKATPDMEIGIMICESSVYTDSVITKLCKMICDAYKHSPVFRIERNGFAVVLQGIDLKNYKKLLESLSSKIGKEQASGEPFSAAIGFSSLIPHEQKNIGQVVKNAEKDMRMNRK